MSVLQLKKNIFQLPSLGRGYDPDKMPLINGDSVIIRPLTVGDQRHLASSADAYQAYFSLMLRLIVEPKQLEIDSLLLDDLHTILFAVRILSFGPDYEIPFDCTACGEPNKAALSLLEVPVKSATELEDFKAEGLELELGGERITIHLLRMSDEKTINRHMQSLKRTKHVVDEKIDRLYVRYAQVIDKIGDQEELPIQDKLEFIDGLTPKDLDNLATFQNDVSVGLVTDMFIPCDNKRCGMDNEVRVGITPQFFRPS